MSNPVLSLKDVTIYQENKVILSQINLEVNQGEFLYIIGKTGTGKSSFMKTLYGDLPLTEGEGHIVEYDLETLQEKDIPYLRRKIGIVFQDFKLLPDRNVNENMLFVLKATGWTDVVRQRQLLGDTVRSKVLLHGSMNHDFFRIASKVGDFTTMGLVEIIHLLKRSDETIFRLTCKNVIVTCPSVYEQKKIFCSVSCVLSDRADDIA